MGACALIDPLHMLWWHLITAISAKEIVPSLSKQPHASLIFFEKEEFYASS
jgi:hypothetical protein